MLSEEDKILQKKYAPNSSEENYLLYKRECQKMGLDVRYVHYQNFRNKKTGKIDASWYITRDGLLENIHRNPKFQGLLSFEVCVNDTFEIDAQNYKITHKFGAKDRGGIIGAWAQCTMKDMLPFITYVSLKEYNNAKSYVWRDYTSSMIKKVAEVIVMKRASGIYGVYSLEEFPLEKRGIDKPITPKKENKPGVMSRSIVKKNIEELTTPEPKPKMKMEKKIVGIPKISKPKTTSSIKKSSTLKKIPSPKGNVKKSPLQLMKKTQKKKIFVKQKPEKTTKTIDLEENITSDMKKMKGDNWFCSETAKSNQKKDYPLFLFQISLSKTDKKLSELTQKQYALELKDKPRNQTLLETYYSSLMDVCMKNMIDFPSLEIFYDDVFKLSHILEEIINLGSATAFFSMSEFEELIMKKTNLPKSGALWVIKYLQYHKSISIKDDKVYISE